MGIENEDINMGRHKRPTKHPILDRASFVEKYTMLTGMGMDSNEATKRARILTNRQFRNRTAEESVTPVSLNNTEFTVTEGMMLKADLQNRDGID